MIKSFLWGDDPGHGGIDSGAIAVDGQTEKAINLVVGMEFARVMRLNNQRVTLTRESDVTVDLNYRPIMLNKAKVDFVVAFHQNSASVKTADGAEVIHSIYYGQGTELAKAIYQSILEGGQNGRKVYSKPLPNNASKDYLCMIRETDAPSVLIEGYFINNPNDYKDIDEYADQIKHARECARGCLRFIGMSDDDIIYEEVAKVPEKQWKDYKQLIREVADPDKAEKHINAIDTIVAAAKASGNLGDIEITEWLPALIEKIGNR